MLSFLLFTTQSFGWSCQSGDVAVEIGSEFEFIDNTTMCSTTILSISFEHGSLMKIISNFQRTTIESIDFTNCTHLESFAAHSFSHCAQLTYILAIPSSVKLLLDYSFDFCYKLSEIDLSPCQNLLEISSFCFHGSSILSILFPNSLETISKYSFYSCADLKAINLANCLSLTLIDIGAFEYSSIESIEFPPSIKDINRNAFLSGKIKSINLSGCLNLKIISRSLFAYSALVTIYFPPSIEEISDDALTSTKIGNIDLSHTQIKSIGKGVFFNLANSFTIRLPDSVERLDEASFGSVQFSNTTFILPRQLKTIGPNAFYLTNIELFYIEDGSSLRTENGIIFSFDSTRLILVPPEKTDFQVDSTNLSIIDKNSFWQSKIEEVNLSKFSNLHTIAEFAFYASSVKSINFPSSLRAILDSAFVACYSLDALDLSHCSDLRYIGADSFNSVTFGVFSFPLNSPQLVLSDFAFRGCIFPGGAVAIPKYIAKAGPGAWCFSAENFEVESGSKLFASAGIFLLNLNQSKIIAFSSRDFGDAVINISDSIEIIGSYSFFKSNCKFVNFTSSSNLRKIEPRAFEGSTLSRISLPNSLIEIGDYAFNNCIHLEETSISKSVQKIGTNPWQNCVKNNFLVDSESLSFSKLNGFLTNSDHSELIVPPGTLNYSNPGAAGQSFDTIKSIAQYAFCYINSHDTLNLTALNNLEVIQPYAFYGSTFITILLPPSVKSIAHHAYSGNQIETFEVTKSLEFLDAKAFLETSLVLFTITESDRFSVVDGILMNKNGSTVLCSPLYLSIGFETSVFVGSSTLTKISKSAFSGSSFNVVDLGNCDHLELIDDFAFAYSYIYSIVFPKAPKASFKIGNSVFEGCTELDDKFVVPKSVNSIGNSVWVVSNNAKIVVEEGSEHFSVVNGTLMNMGQTIIYCASPFGNGVFIGTDKIIEIKENCFKSCSRMVLIDLSMTKITVLPKETFYNCSCQTVALPCNLQEIGEKCFIYSSVEVLSVPDSVTTIKQGAFSSSYSLKYLKLPKRLADIPKELCFCNIYLEYLILPENNFRTTGDDSFSICPSICGAKAPTEENKLKLIEAGMLDFAFNECEKTPPAIPESSCPSGPPSGEFSTFVDAGNDSGRVLSVLSIWGLLKWQ